MKITGTKTVMPITEPPADTAALNRRSARRIRTDTLKRAGTYVFSTVCGLMTAAGMILLSALLMYTAGMPPQWAGVFGVFSLGAGCMLSGFICGRIKGHAGLRHGFRCAVIMVGAVMLLSLVSGSMDGSAAAVKTITAVITGCTGGVLGVNSRSE